MYKYIHIYVYICRYVNNIISTASSEPRAVVDYLSYSRWGGVTNIILSEQQLKDSRGQIPRLHCSRNYANIWDVVCVCVCVVVVAYKYCLVSANTSQVQRMFRRVCGDNNTRSVLCRDNGRCRVVVGFGKLFRSSLGNNVSSKLTRSILY